jgi:hypothetical protein
MVPNERSHLGKPELGHKPMILPDKKQRTLQTS